MLRPLLLLYFASGCAALIYETVWFHLVQLVVGASAISVAVLLCSFMGGMALGSAWLPRLMPATAHPLRVVAALEAGIALCGWLIPLLLPVVQDVYVAVVGYGYGGILLRGLVCGLVIAPPTMLMGATLPVVARWLETGRDGAARTGLIYAANIAGGALGTVLAGFYLMRGYDTVIAGAGAVAINSVVAVVAWTLARTHPEVRLKPDATSDDGATRLNHATARASLTPIYVVAAMSGFTALGAEVVWTRQPSLLFGASVSTFSLILAVFLTGLGAGSLAGSALGRRSSDPALWLGRVQLCLAASPAVQQSLAQVSLPSAASILSTYAGRGSDLAPWLVDAESNRERHLRLQYLTGLAANFDERFVIFQAMLAYRRYPADLFVASTELEAQLRRWYAPAGAR